MHACQHPNDPLAVSLMPLCQPIYRTQARTFSVDANGGFSRYVLARPVRKAEDSRSKNWCYRARIVDSLRPEQQ